MQEYDECRNGFQDGMEQVGKNRSRLGAPEAEATLGRLRLIDLLNEFAAGKEVPGSGCANALTAAIAACLTASVAAKTHRSDALSYIHVKQTAVDTERRARKIAERLARLLEDDSAAFAPVVALRRETGKAIDKILQDDARRKEVAALKPATEIPLEIARLAVETGQLALTMLDSGFQPARGESYTALLQSIAAVDGAMFVARLNLLTVKRRIEKLNDPLLEADWIKRISRDLHNLSADMTELQVRQDLARKAIEKQQ